MNVQTIRLIASERIVGKISSSVAKLVTIQIIKSMLMTQFYHIIIKQTINYKSKIPY